MSIERCPVCGTELWADGHITEDGAEFWGPVSAGYCPKCHKYFSRRTGKEVKFRPSWMSRLRRLIFG